MMKNMRVIIIALILVALVSLLVILLLRRRTTNTTIESTQTGTTQVNQEVGAQSPGDAQITMNKTAAREIVIEASDYKFTPNVLTLKKGETVKITLKNTGNMAHDWRITGMEGASIETTNAGQSNSILVTPSQTGNFPTFCSIGNHRRLGMEGKLVIQ